MCLGKLGQATTTVWQFLDTSVHPGGLRMLLAKFMGMFVNPKAASCTCKVARAESICLFGMHVGFN